MFFPNIKSKLGDLNTNSCALLGRIKNFLNKFYNKLYIMINVENTQTIVNDSEKKNYFNHNLFCRYNN